MRLHVRFVREQNPMMIPGSYGIQLPDPFEKVWVIVTKVEPGEVDVEVP